MKFVTFTDRGANITSLCTQLLYDMIFTAYSSSCILYQGAIVLFHCHPMVYITLIMSFTSQGCFTRKQSPGIPSMGTQLPHGPTKPTLNYLLIHAGMPSLTSFCKVSPLQVHSSPIIQYRPPLTSLLLHIRMNSPPKKCKGSTLQVHSCPMGQHSPLPSTL